MHRRSSEKIHFQPTSTWLRVKQKTSDSRQSPGRLRVCLWHFLSRLPPESISSFTAISFFRRCSTSVVVKKSNFSLPLLHRFVVVDVVFSSASSYGIFRQAGWRVAREEKVCVWKRRALFKQRLFPLQPSRCQIARVVCAVLWMGSAFGDKAQKHELPALRCQPTPCHPHSIPNLFPHSRSIILSHKIPFYYHTAKAEAAAEGKRGKNRKLFLCALHRRRNFVISSERLNSRRYIHVSSSSFAACAIPSAFLFLSLGAYTFLPSAFILSPCTDENDDLAHGERESL